MSSDPPPAVRLVSFFSGVALLTGGNILTLYGAHLLRGAFGSPFGNQLANAAVPFLLLCLPLFTLYAAAEVRGFRLSRLFGLPVRHSPWLTAGLFAVLGVAWLFVRASLSYREAAKADAALAKPTAAEPPLRAPGREFVETVVFVVVLVSMLNVFVVQAFVIPTGSMAETLYGYKKVVTCPECGYVFPVNASREAEPQGGADKLPTVGYCCPNCRYETTTGAKEVAWGSGDRVLVGKFLSVDHRGHVVVFKFPDAPQTGQVAQNYIKRLVGLPGETVALLGGDLYATRALDYPIDARGDDGRPLYPRPDDPNDLWRAPYSVVDFEWDPERKAARKVERARWSKEQGDFRYTNATAAFDLFRASQAAGFALGDRGFEIVRKPDDLVMAMRRIVYDNDHQSANLVKVGVPPRWEVQPDAGGGWAADRSNAPKTFTHAGGEFGWVRYRHLMPDGPRPGWSGTAANVTVSPRKISNFMGYNAGYELEAPYGPKQTNLDNSNHWVGDLMVECRAKAAGDAAVVLEVSKGEYRYRAEFEKGQVRLKMFPATEVAPQANGNGRTQDRVVPVGDDGFTLASAPSGVKAETAHHLRFANVDCRLRVWVDDTPIDFGGKADYAPPPPPTTFLPEDADKEGWTRSDIDRPVTVGASGSAEVSGLKVWRDTYYVNATDGRDPDGKPFPAGRLDTYYVQPGHYLCMGDNSSQSSDGRMWGLVPERLMLGRAVFIFFPFPPISPDNRLGFIR